MALKYVQSNTLYLAGSGLIVGATNVVLTSFSDVYGNALAMSDFGTKGYGTLEPDTTNEEAFTFTNVSVNANGTVTLGGVSTALAKSPYTETSGLVRQHSGGTKVVITDNVAFWNTFANKNNDETITGRWGSATVPSAGNDYANKTYVDGVAVAGAPNASTTVKGIVQEATQAQTDARTTTGSTGADLYVNPSTQRSTLLSDYKADTGAANAYVITPVPAATAYTVGQIFSFKATSANTTASTLNVNGLGAKTIKRSDGSTDLVANDIKAGQIVLVEYDGTNFVMISESGNLALSTNGNGASLTGIPVATNILTLTSNGTWTKPSGALFVLIECWGGGGAGGSVQNSGWSGGGGGGGYMYRYVPASTLTATVAITIGAGGTPGAAGANPGGAGGNTTFGSYVTGIGGSGGAAGVTSSTSAGGAGGGTSPYSGGAGATSDGSSIFAGNNALFAAGGGGAGVQLGSAGAGGTSAGDGGAGGSGTGNGAGAAGSVPGGGGGGSGSNASGTKQGGAGASGQVRVTTFF